MVRRRPGASIHGGGGGGGGKSKEENVNNFGALAKLQYKTLRAKRAAKLKIVYVNLVFSC